MKAIIKLLVIAALFCATSLPMLAQDAAPSVSPQRKPPPSAKAAATSTEPPTIQKRLEAYFRNLFALGPSVDVAAGPVMPGPTPDFNTVEVKITIQGMSSVGRIYLSKDGRYMFRGEIEDLNVDPLADIRKQIQLDGYASWGPANAKVTIVEYGDLECPSCRQYEPILRDVRAKYPQVRLVFKDFPLEQIHPWAKTAALAAHCVLQQSTDAFWKFHDTVYDDQDQVTPQNASDKLAEFAAAAGADPTAYKTCIADPATLDIVTKSQDEGRSLGISGTPTTFVNGRRITGPDPNLLAQYLNFDLGAEGADSPATPTSSPPSSTDSPAAPVSQGGGSAVSQPPMTSGSAEMHTTPTNSK